jgi:ABC-type phosphate transport system substrate-binding protein
MKLFATALLAAMAGSPAAAQPVISLHGSGTTNPSKCYWTIMDQMKIQAKLPIEMTYRAVGSSTGQAEFIGDGVTSDNMFGSGDIAFSQENYDSFPADSILHLPVVLGAISFFHSVDTGSEKLNLSPCILAKILKRDITDWGDDEIAQANPNLSLPNPSPITVAHRVKGSSSTASITSYLNQVCPEEWPAELVGKTIDWPEDTIGCEGSGGMSACIKGKAGTIGYIDMGHGHAEQLQEIELLNASQKYISSKEAAAAGGIMAAAENAALPPTLEGSFADVNLLNQVSVMGRQNNPKKAELRQSSF